MSTRPGSTLQLAIEGMSCAACVRRVERALAAVPGVEQVSVNLATETAYLGSAAPLPSAPLIAALRAAGYDGHVPAVPGTPSVAEHPGVPWPLLAGLLLCLPLLAPMALSPSGVHWMPSPWLQFGLALPVQVWLGARFYVGAWRALREGSSTMDVLVALGTSAAFLLSCARLWQWQRLGGDMPELYFEASAAVITLVLLGKQLERRARHSTADALRGLQALRPEHARVVAAEGEHEVPLAAVRTGDRIRVLPGERIPVDAEILEGSSAIDESLITGESLPVQRGPGTQVIGGALNGESVLLIRALGMGGTGALERIIHLVEQAQAEKAPIQDLVDRISAWFVPMVLGIAALTFLVAWRLLGDPGQALINAVSVLVIACPCALGLATPTALLVGTGVAARRGILIRDAASLEAASRLTLIAFDKTGTLTEGHPTLLAVHPATGVTRAEVQQLAGALQSGSRHPLAQPVLQAAAQAGLTLPVCTAATSLAGRGVRGNIAGQTVWLGNGALLTEIGARAVQDPEFTAEAEAALARGETLAWLARAEAGGTVEILGWLSFGDQTRPEARAAVEALHVLGLRTRLLSGDQPASVARVAAACGVQGSAAALLPAGKVDALKSMRAEGEVVAMVGDGLNDAPALAAADVGMALASGTDVAMAAAGITLMRSDLRLVPDAVRLARKITRRIHWTLALAFVYNLAGIPLAAFGWLSPMVAGTAMALSSVSVVCSALLLRWGETPPARPGH